MKLEANTSSAPALSRGLEILEFLQLNGRSTLGEMAERLGFPKASLLRLLQTLQRGAYVLREADKSFSSCVFLFKDRAQLSLQASIRAVLEGAAQSSSMTAEWYTFSDRGMLLVDQCRPAHTESGVFARRGYLRGWDAELEGVSQVGHALFGIPLKAGHWVGGAGAANKKITRATAQRMVQAAKKNGWAADPYFNSNGVRRTAVGVYASGQPAGVMALAEMLTPLQPADSAALVKSLVLELKRESSLLDIKPTRKTKRQ